MVINALYSRINTWSLLLQVEGFDTISNKFNLHYKSEKHKKAIGREKSILPAPFL